MLSKFSACFTNFIALSVPHALHPTIILIFFLAISNDVVIIFSLSLFYNKSPSPVEPHIKIPSLLALIWRTISFSIASKSTRLLLNGVTSATIDPENINFTEVKVTEYVIRFG